MKRGWKIAGAVVGTVAVGAAGFVGWQAHAFDASMARAHARPLPTLARSSDEAVVTRGKHLAESVGACASADCHGADLAGGKPIAMGPLATLTGPNITGGGKRAGGYTVPELARLVRHGVKRDGRGVAFMPVHEISWLPDDDLVAIGSYLATVPSVDKADGETRVGLLGKLLDRQGKLVFDVARHIEQTPRSDDVPRPEPTARYGAFLARACTGCHGDGLSGGKIPGTPSSVPIPANLTPHAGALGPWSFDDFQRLLATGVKRDGKRLDPFMPLDAVSRLDDIEKKALWAYLRSLPPRPFGGR